MSELAHLSSMEDLCLILIPGELWPPAIKDCWQVIEQQLCPPLEQQREQLGCLDVGIYCHLVSGVAMQGVEGINHKGSGINCIWGSKPSKMKPAQKK